MYTYINLIGWIVICIILCWTIKERYLIDCYIHKKVNKRIKNQHILTYNIQRLPWSLKPICLLRPIVRPHSIVFLQECFSNVLYDEIQHAFNEYHIIKGTMTRYTLVNSGLVILTTYPVLSHTFIPYNVQDYLSTDVLSEKGFLVVEVKINQRHIYLINTHLQSSFLNEPNIISTQQMQQLLLYVQTLEHPYIIGGDFNVDYKDLPAPIKKNLTVYAPDQPTIYIEYDKDNTELNTSCVPVSGYTPFCYDYFMTRDIMITNPTVLSFEYSDHAPVQTTIVL